MQWMVAAGAGSVKGKRARRQERAHGGLRRVRMRRKSKILFPAPRFGV